MKKRLIGFLMAAAWGILLLPVVAAHQAMAAPANPTSFSVAGGNITIEPASSTTTQVVYGANNFYFPNGTPLTITGSSPSNTVTVTAGTYGSFTANITLDDVNISNSSASPFSIESGATVNLTVDGTNVLNADPSGSSNNSAGLSVPSGAILNIAGTGSLAATGGGYGSSTGGAGIGGGYYISSGIITINGSTITATGGGSGGAGIGGGTYGANGIITINGGTVQAFGTPSGNGAGIGDGGGFIDNGDAVIINGGTVTAKGGLGSSNEGGAGIGGGWGGGISQVTVTGGIVSATGQGGGAGIGGGYDNSNSSNKVTISGGFVYAAGSSGDYGTWVAPGVDGTATISGGSVNASFATSVYSASTGGVEEYETTITGLPDNTSVSYTVSGATYAAYTDGNSNLYLWLTGSGSTTDIQIIANRYSYTASGTVGSTITATENPPAVPMLIGPTNATFTVGQYSTFSFTTTGNPIPTLTKTGALPNGVTFTDNGDGTATLSGTLAAGTGGNYPITITATNGISSVTQDLTLTVDQAPSFTSRNSATFVQGYSGTFTVTTAGYPAAALTESGTLPTGVTFTDSGNGTATISGTPTETGSYTITIDATNAPSGVVSDPVQTFTLTVLKPVSVKAINLTPPVTGVAPQTSVSDNGQYAASISWSPTVSSGGTFAAGTQYTATIDINPDNGYTLVGVPANFFTVSGATMVTNAVYSGALTVTAVFPTTAATSGNSGGSTGGGGGGGAPGLTTTGCQGLELTVPPGAFASPVTIATQTLSSSQAYAPPGQDFVGASPECTIDAGGVQPGKPVLAIFGYTAGVLQGLSPLRLGIYRYDPATAAWQWVGGRVDGADDTVSAELRQFGIYAVFANTASFHDLTQAPWARNAVDTLLGANLTAGVAPGTFDPEGALTRAEFATFLVKALDLYQQTNSTTPFGDVASTAWYAPYAAAAYNAGIVAGTGPNTFDPNGLVTREEAAVMLMKAMSYGKLTGQTPPGNAPTFTDQASVSGWAQEAVQQAGEYGLIHGYPDGSFQPQGTLTRAEGAVMLANLLPYEQRAGS